MPIKYVVDGLTKLNENKRKLAIEIATLINDFEKENGILEVGWRVDPEVKLIRREELGNKGIIQRVELDLSNYRG